MVLFNQLAAVKKPNQEQRKLEENLLTKIFGSDFITALGGAEFLVNMGFILALHSAYLSYLDN